MNADTTDTGATDTTDTDTSATNVNADATHDDATVTDWKAEAERLKADSRRHEAESKRYRDELNAARAVTAEQFQRALVGAEFRAAAAGRNLDIDALLDGLDASRFIGADGHPDVTRIVRVLDGLAPLTPKGPPAVVRLDLAAIAELRT